MNKIKLSVFISLLALSVSSANAFDLGKSFSDAIDKKISKAQNKAKDKAARKVHKLAMTTLPPKLAKNARLDDMLPVDLSKGVYIFGHQGCPPTRQAYAFLKNKGVKYRNMDVARDKKAARLSKERRVRGYPTLYVNGEQMVGFGPQQYTALLKKHKMMK